MKQPLQDGETVLNYPSSDRLTFRFCSNAYTEEGVKENPSRLCLEIFVDLSYQLVAIGSVNGTSRLDGLASGCGASQAVHSDIQKEFCCTDIIIKNIADD